MEANMSRIVVLGCGAVGKHMAIDLCRVPGYQVISVDVNQESLERLAREHPIQTRVEDLSMVEGVTRAVELSLNSWWRQREGTKPVLTGMTAI